MLHAQSRDAARAAKKTYRKDTFEGDVTDFIATHDKRQPGAQAFLVEQDPNWVTPPHYHVEHQFQIVTAGDGAIGRHAVAPLTVHYAAPETGYGPITAGPRGLSYLTLRIAGDTGAWYLHQAGSRERMQPGLKREQRHGAPAGTMAADVLANLVDTTLEELIAPRGDGLAAHLVRVAPNRQCDLPAAGAHGGRFYVITQGEAVIAGAVLPALSVVFASAEENPNLRAGAAGIEVIVLQFPQSALRPDATAANSSQEG